MVHHRINNISFGVTSALLAGGLYGLLCYLYIVYINPVFPRMYFIEVSVWKITFGIVLTMMTAGVVHAATAGSDRPSRIPLYLIFVGLIVPLNALHGLRDGPTSFVIAGTGLFVLMVIALSWLPLLRVPRLDRVAVYIGVVGVFAMTVYVYVSLLATGGVERLNIDLENIYETRLDFKDRARFPFAGYLVPWVAYVVNSLVLCVAIVRRKLSLVVLVLVLQVFIFAMTNFRSFLFAPVLVVALYIISDRRNVLSLIMAGGVIVVASSHLWFLYSGDHLWSSIVTRRLFFVPASNHLFYFEWFSQNPKIMLSNSILSFAVDNPYSDGPASVIAREIYGRDGRPNVGFFGDAYAQFGFFGMGLYTVLLTSVLMVVDGMSRWLPSRIICPVLGIASMPLLNSALLTVFATHGLLFAVFCLWAIAGRRFA